MKPITVNVRDVIHKTTITVHVSNPKATRLRLWCGAQIIKFGGWITGFQSTIVHINQE